MKKRNNKTIKIARKNSEKLYFTGLFCKNGHIDYRLVSNSTCLSCKRTAAAKTRIKKGQTPKEKFSPLQIAKAENKIWYYTGIPCKNGHISKRLVSDRSCYCCSKTKSAKHKINNRARYTTLQMGRKAAQLKATPSWANQDLIAVQYIKAKFMEWFTGEKYHVDHIIPLQGKEVCGLHVEYNLQVIPAKENISKSNKLEI